MRGCVDARSRRRASLCMLAAAHATEREADACHMYVGRDRASCPESVFCDGPHQASVGVSPFDKEYILWQFTSTSLTLLTCASSLQWASRHSRSVCSKLVDASSLANASQDNDLISTFPNMTILDFVN